MFSLQKTILGTRIFDRRVYLFLGAILTLFVFDGVAIHYSLYYFHRWLDIPVHLAAGALVGMLMYYFVFANHVSAKWLNAPRTGMSVFLVMVLGVLVVAVGWEVVEFLAGRTVVSPRLVPDTLLDLFVGVAGAVGAYGLIDRRNR